MVYEPRRASECQARTTNLTAVSRSAQGLPAKVEDQNALALLMGRVKRPWTVHALSLELHKFIMEDENMKKKMTHAEEIEDIRSLVPGSLGTEFEHDDEGDPWSRPILQDLIDAAEPFLAGEAQICLLENKHVTSDQVRELVSARSYAAQIITPDWEKEDQDVAQGPPAKVEDWDALSDRAFKSKRAVVMAAYAGWADAQRAQCIEHQHHFLWNRAEHDHAKVLYEIGVLAEHELVANVFGYEQTYLKFPARENYPAFIAKEVAEHPDFDPQGKEFAVVSLEDLLSIAEPF
jgi:hypothetical protein